MKKFLCLIMGILIILSSSLFAACDTDVNEENGSTPSESGTVTETSTESETETPVETLENGSIVVESVGGKSAYELYLGSLEDELTNYTINSTTASITEYGASKTVSTINADISIDGEKAYLVTSSPDTPYVSGEMWYADGYLYTNMDGEKYKEQISYDDFLFAYVSEFSPDYDELGLEEDDFDSAVIAKNTDGSYSVIIDISNIMDDMLDELESGEEDLGTYTVTCELIFNEDGTMKGTVATSKVTMEMDGMTICTSNSSSCEISNIGTTTVTLPEDADAYEEYDWGFDDDEFPDMSDWTDEEIESWYDAYWGEDIEE